MSLWRFAPRAWVVAVSLVTAALITFGCGRSDLDDRDLLPDGGFAVGGTPGVGGGIGSGGRNTGGRLATGGFATGGFTSDGGFTGGGGFTIGGGGGVFTGGVPGSGGFTGFGGSLTGGLTGFGGFFTGGLTGFGGFVTGGNTGFGGILVTGGITGGGGILVTGGRSNTGGASTGGRVNTGGVATGGVTGQPDGGLDCRSTCAGCCNARGECFPGTQTNACGSSGAKCLDCGSSGFGCDNGSCRGAPTPCSVSTCDGCCDTLGRCRAGDETDACGAGGGFCAVCSGASSGCGPAGKCQGPPPSCGPDNCGGCCTAAGLCVTGTNNTACGTAGAKCDNCTAAGRTCNQPGSYCTFVPTCSATTCPDGCCDANGVCRNGRADAACGAAGQKCSSCGASGQHCAASGFCYDGPHCGPDNCGGCCTANGQCTAGSTSARCGIFGDLCDNCSTKGQTCQSNACAAPGATCPAPYGGCNPGVLTTPPTTSQSCAEAELAAVAKVCQGTRLTPACQGGIQALLRTSPGCFDCLQPFTSGGAVAACLAPFISASCNHNLTCSLGCQLTSCGQCADGDVASCQSKAVSATGACSPYVSGNYCADAAFGGPGAFCDVARIGDVGLWLQGVGAYYCYN